MDYDTAISEILRTISDREWHAAYEFHVKYNLSALEIYNSILALGNMGLIERQGTEIRIREDLDERGLSIMNRLSKTSRPRRLYKYTPRPLTSKKNGV
ncbi:hypothetical protein LGN24_27270 [Burkholderia seminalis]|uniref:hypothetical protein n=1 Tax=Burkholderia seminalis TaxID=488731 RepID=UPI001CF33B55|nr:hypothetical protein [Burkholderia seminalis]MCA8305191.1 hypothetical protein [Burkholderia seminalis]